MPSGPLRSSEYGRAFDQVLNQVVDERVGQDALVAMARVRRSRHRGPLRNVKTQVADRPPTKTSVRFSLDRDLRADPIGAFRAFVNHLVESSLRTKSLQLQETLIEATQVAGADLDGDKSLTWQNYLRAVEHMELSFDEEGRTYLPKLIGGPGAKASLEASNFPEDFDERLNDILERKRRDWLAAQRSRRLS